MGTRPECLAELQSGAARSLQLNRQSAAMETQDPPPADAQAGGSFVFED